MKVLEEMETATISGFIHLPGKRMRLLNEFQLFLWRLMMTNLSERLQE